MPNAPRVDRGLVKHETPSPHSNSVVNGIRGLAIKTSERSPKIFRDDADYSGTAVEPLDALSPHPCLNSDDEIIIFSGRARRNLQENGSKADINSSMSNAEENTTIVPQKVPSPRVSSMDRDAASCKDSKIRKGKKESRSKYSQNWAKQKRAYEEVQDSAIADYISNMQSTDGTSDSVIGRQFQTRDLDLDGGSETLEELDIDEEIDHKIRDNEDWDSSDLQDFEGFSSSSEAMDATPRILRRRFKDAEAQYLVVASGATVDEARWLTRNLLTAPTASDSIDRFEEDRLNVRRFAADGILSEGSSTQDTVEDEKDLRQRKKAHVSDEHVARLLSKQAELGLIGDDLVLFDDHAFDETSTDNVAAIGAAVTSPKSRRKSKKRTGNRFLSAPPTNENALDYLDDFDVMDYERPSLRKSAKGKHPHDHVLDLSDSDLQESMIATWQSDRTKKKQRKQERELLRSQGVLGKTGKRDVRKKAGGDLATGDIIREVKAFLQSSATSCSLPPMDQRERKLIHIIAHKSGLKSKSLGSGAARFPILYRTSRTKPLTPGLEAEMNALFTRRHPFRRYDKDRQGGIAASRNGTAGMTTAASYRDGEIVGIGAPEIGTENKGRTMLEKMGWTTGNSLGASKNKGIAQPIEQVVKTSKAGLG